MPKKLIEIASEIVQTQVSLTPMPATDIASSLRQVFSTLHEMQKGLPANAYLDSLHAKPDRGRVKESRGEEQQQDTAWAEGSVGLLANVCLCCLDTELQAKSLR